MYKFLFALMIFLNSELAYSDGIEPKSMGSETRFKVWTYYPNTVYKFTGFYMHPTYIEFEEGEAVATISTPKPKAWQFVANGFRLFIKPVEDDANTTATVMTNKRVYFFELHAKESRGPFDSRLSFYIKFRYPSGSADATNPSKSGEDESEIVEYQKSVLPDLSKPEKFNFNYTISGDESISPIKVFDDGVFTYLEFVDKNATLPAIFGVNNNGLEFILNYRIMGNYYVIESVEKMFTLRNGSDIACVYNELKRAMKDPKGKGGGEKLPPLPPKK
jgi:type IV secretion system protein VirB9